MDYAGRVDVAEAVCADIAADEHEARSPVNSDGQSQPNWKQRWFDVRHLHDPEQPIAANDTPAPRAASPAPSGGGLRVAVLGARGMLGPSVISELDAAGCDLRLTDISRPELRDP